MAIMKYDRKNQPQVKIHLSEEKRKELKVYCAKRGITIQDLLEKYILSKLADRQGGDAR